jgi:hypothetical protein
VHKGNARHVLTYALQIPVESNRIMLFQRTIQVVQKSVQVHGNALQLCVRIHRRRIWAKTKWDACECSTYTSAVKHVAVLSSLFVCKVDFRGDQINHNNTARSYITRLLNGEQVIKLVSTIMSEDPKLIEKLIKTYPNKWQAQEARQNGNLPEMVRSGSLCIRILFIHI